jgi:hypothetical protein
MPPVKDISENKTPQTFWEKSRKYVFIAIIALLAVTLLLPTAVNQARQGDAVLAEVNGHRVTQREFMNFRNQWEQLMRLPMNAGERTLPAVAILPPDAIAAVQTHQDMFMLLALEARNQGVRTSPDEVKTFLRNSVSLPPDISADAEESLIRSVSTLFSVQRMYQRAASSVKVSQPLVDLELATRLKEVDIDFVEFTAGEFLAGLAAPTPEQLQTQFKQYADTLAPLDTNTPTAESNPYGLGYKLPNRIKLQYIGFTRDALARAVTASKSEYDWEVAARKYFMENPNEFRRSAEAVANPNAKLEDVIGPRPFAEVKNDILAKLQQQEQTRLAERIRNRLLSQFATDFAPYMEAAAKAGSTGASTAPTAEPITRFGVSYKSPEYLSKVAATIQQETGVILTVASILDAPQGAADLARLAGIGSSATAGGLPFPMYATRNISTLIPAGAARPDGKVLALYEPSPVLTDAAGVGQYIFRATEALVASAPAEMPTATVTDDWKMVTAFEAAKAAAASLQSQANTTTLEAAGTTAGRFIKQAGNVRLIQPAISGLQVSPVSFGPLRQGLTQAISAQQAGKPSVTVVPLPRDRKVLVVSIRDSRANTFGIPADMLTGEIRRQVRMGTAQLIAPGWFDYEQVKARTNFKAIGG